MKSQLHLRRVLKLVGPLLAIHYLQAAKRDENDGFPFTAAMEWRNAAELSSWIKPLANRYWQKWERIMRVPRRFAEPIGIAQVVADSGTPAESAFQSCRAVRVVVPRQVVPQVAA